MTEGVIPLSDPDITPAELEVVRVALQQPSLTGGPMVQVFEQAFAAYLGREHAVAFCGGQMALMMALKACGVGAGDEVIASPYSYREAVNAIALLGAQPVFSDIDYWSGTLVAEKIEPRLTSRTRAIVGGNPNGHPAAWSSLRKLAEWRGLTLIEDSTEAIGSSYGGALVGTFGDCSVFDFSQPGPISCGEGGMVVTDDPLVAAALRRHRGRRPDQRASVSSGTVVAHQVGMSDIAAALGLAQLQRLDTILAKRKTVEHYYGEYIRSFEGIKPPFVAPEVDEIHWFLYVVHLGTRFTRTSRDAIVDDLLTEQVTAAAYALPLHLRSVYLEAGYKRGDYPMTEKVAERAIALPFHTHLTESKVAFIAQTLKDASINVGAGAAIYL